MEVKPYYLPGFLKHSLLSWAEYEHALNTSEPHQIEWIDDNHEKHPYDKKKIQNNTVILSGLKKHKLDYTLIKDFLALRDSIPYQEWGLHAYASYKKGNVSFPSHWDFANNYIIQCEGRCRWILQGHFDIVLTKGDLIFIPAKCVHQCVPLEKRLSLSFPLWEKKKFTQRSHEF